ncbi:hypothetical protein C8Q80DRAFT_1303775 [Daedaleopsis nitida]|nr:hypothetical protein C8Q80DRAFT_1303775 [Daedaleopsis nitida]
MSARAPFIPRSPSVLDSNPAEKPASPAAHEPFRPNGLLSNDTHTPHPEQRNATPSDLDKPTSQDSVAMFKPLNVSGVGKAKSNPHNSLSARPAKSRPSIDSNRASKPYASAQHRHLAVPRPSSPFFPNTGMVTMNAFRVPPPPSHGAQLPDADDLSSNKAHIGTAYDDSGFGEHSDLHPKHIGSAPASDSFRFLDTSFASSHRSRTASHPSLASIHEVDEEEDGSGPRKVHQMGPSLADAHGSFSGDYSDSFSDSGHTDGRFSQGLRRTAKRVERAVDEEDEYEYGTDAKRYKMASHQDEYTTVTSRRATPARYSGGDLNHSTAPVQALPVHPVQENSKVAGEPDSKQALYQLLGHDLDICVEAHADAYEQARKKWSECSVEEWTKGGDDLGERFGKMLDLVKDHMTMKLSLYASLHNTISEHRTALSEREKVLDEAKDSLLREGGAVVGGIPKMGGGETKEM